MDIFATHTRINSAKGSEFVSLASAKGLFPASGSDLQNPEVQSFETSYKNE
jgi:hypothetical protein